MAGARSTAGRVISPITSVLFFGGWLRPFPNVAFLSFLDVVPPAGVDDTTVEVAVVNPDGQAHARDAYFYYVPQPTLTGLTDRAGVPVTGGSTAGGMIVRLLGTFFRKGQIVHVGASAFHDVAMPGIIRESASICTSLSKICSPMLLFGNRLKTAYVKIPVVPLSVCSNPGA